VFKLGILQSDEVAHVSESNTKDKWR